MSQFKLLLIDDEAIILKSYARLLHLHFPKLHLLEAKNGIEGWELIQSKKPDAILLDLAMPKMNGFELLSLLAENNVCIPVVVMTAFGTDANIELAKLSANNAQIQVIHKPVDMSVLLHCFSGLMEAQ